MFLPKKKHECMVGFQKKRSLRVIFCDNLRYLNSFALFLAAAKGVGSLPTVPEVERHHSVPAMTNHTAKRRLIQRAKRSTRWTLLADNVQVKSRVSLCSVIVWK